MRLQEMIDEADRDGDGEVSLEEFERIMKVCSCQRYKVKHSLGVAIPGPQGLGCSITYKLSRSGRMQHAVCMHCQDKFDINLSTKNEAPPEETSCLQKTSLF